MVACHAALLARVAALGWGLPFFTGWSCEALLRADARAVRVCGLHPGLGGGVGLPRAFLWPSGLPSRLALQRPAVWELPRGATPPAARVTHRGLLDGPPEDYVESEINPYARRRVINRGGLFRSPLTFNTATTQWNKQQQCCATCGEQLVAPNNALDAYTSSCQAAVQNRCAKRTVASCRHALVEASKRHRRIPQGQDADAPTKRARTTPDLGPRRPDHRRGLGALQQCETANNHLKNTALFHVTAPLRAAHQK